MFIRRARPVGKGFVIGFAALTLVMPPTVTLWFGYPARVLKWNVIEPMKRRSDARKARHQELERRPSPIGLQPPLWNAVTHIGRLDSGCVRALRNRGVPPPVSEREMWRVPACTAERRNALGDQSISEGDDGWRWSLVASLADSTGVRIILQPNSAIKLHGPIVELDGGWLRIRDHDKAPYHTFSTPIPMMRRLRECLLLAASKEPPANIPQWQFFPQSRAMRRACTDFTATSTRVTEAGDPNVLITLPNGISSPRFEHGELTLRVLAPGRFEIRGRAWERRYLLDADGKLHVSTGRRGAQVSDGAPSACELDIRTPCGA
ncbi:MAG: hypothetical protein WD825_04630 [Gemmatimonadaceae bacterium]